jgi:hypothetical protein
MPVHPVRTRYILLGFAVIVQLVVTGCQFRPGENANIKVEAFVCQNKIVVNATAPPFVDQEPFVLYDQTTIHWDMATNVKDFEVEFTDGLPFGPNATKFGTKPGETQDTPIYKAPTVATLYNYKITVTDATGAPKPPYDPHVVGGGGIGGLIYFRPK